MAALGLLHIESLSPRSQEIASELGASGWADDFYLAGSAALGLYTGHRPVRDLDLMTGTNRLTSPERRDLLGHLLSLDKETEVETARDGYLFVRMSGVGVRFYYYPYPLVEPFENLAGLSVIAAVDLGLMKLGAIISRGTRRDFVDLYLLCRDLPLAELLHRAEDKFGHVRDFPLQALKGLADFTQIEGDPMPRLALPLAWEDVETWLRSQVQELGRARIGLP